MPVAVRNKAWLFLRKPLLFLGSAVIAFTIGELMVRALGIAPRVYPLWTLGELTSFQRSTNPILGYEYKPNFRSDNPATAEATVVFSSINSDGLRDIERDIPKPRGTRRIILLGDSVVSGHGLPNLDHTISRRLEDRFDDPSIEVLNVSVCGYNTRAEVELLSTKGLKYEPDLVVLLFTSNDYEDSNAGGDVARYGGTMRGAPLLMRLCLSSSLARATAVELGLIQLGDTIDVARWHAGAMGTNNVADGLRELKRLSNKHNFAVLVAVWPGFVPGRVVSWSTLPIKEIDQSQIIPNLAAEMEFPIEPLAPFFRRHLAEIGLDVDPAEYFTIGDHMHPSIVGANVAADALVSICSDMLERRSPQVPSSSTTINKHVPDSKKLKITPIASLDHPHAVAVRPRSNRVYVAEAAQGRIIAVDPQRHDLEIDVVASIKDAVLTSVGFVNGSMLWVTGSDQDTSLPWLRLYVLPNGDATSEIANGWIFQARANGWGQSLSARESWNRVLPLPGSPSTLLVAAHREVLPDLIRRIDFSHADQIAHPFAETDPEMVSGGLVAITKVPNSKDLLVAHHGTKGRIEDSSLTLIDSESGLPVAKGSLPLCDVTDIEFHPLSHALYALDRPLDAPDEGRLYRIDMTHDDDTVAFKRVDIVGLASPIDMAFDLEGRLFVALDPPVEDAQSPTRTGELVCIEGIK